MKNLWLKNLIFAGAVLLSCKAIAQPANDFCNNAQSITPNGTCVAGTTVGAADNWTGTVGCQTGNANSHPDAWYSFVSTGNTYTATITGSGSWTGNVEFTLVTGTCAGGFTAVGSACGASPLNVNIPGIINGTTYYFTISNDATGTPGPFQVCSSTTISPVPGNDDCANATSLGTLPTPGACGSGVQNGTAVVVAGTNVNATAETPYVTLNGCGMASPANSVWYRFVDPPSGYGLTITVSGGTLANPNIALWNGTTCGSLAGVNCIVGSGNTATLTISNGIVPGQTYYIQLSGNTGETGTYNLSVNAFQDCTDCLNAASITATPPPVNGTYQPGQVVSFCFHIDRWTQTVNNWLHGVQLAFGAGWDLPTLTTTPPPAYVSTSAFWGAVNPPTCGVWGYYPAGTISSATGVAWPAGFYFNGVYTTNILGLVTGCGSLVPNNPGNNFGDGVANSGLVITPPANQWNFCWTVTVKPGCNPGMSLSIAVNTSGDGESGSWTSAGCSNDPPVNFSAQIGCCPPTMASTGTCTGLSTGTATTTPVGNAGPYTYTWSAGGQNSPTITGLTSGNYTVTVIDANLCSASASVAVAANPLPVSNAGLPVSLCSGISGSIGAPATAGYTYAWSPTTGLNNSTAANPTVTLTNITSNPVTTAYTVTTTITATGCTSTATVNVTVNPLPAAAPTVTPSPICVGQSTLLAANATPGSGVISTYAWSSGLAGNSSSGNVSPITNTTYTVTVTNSNTCSATGTVSVTVNANPNVAPSVSPSAICNGGSSILAANAVPGSGIISSYLWSSSLAGNTAGGGVSPTTNTTYSVTVTNSNACTATGTVSITVNANPTVAPTASPNPICVGASTTLTANAIAGTGAIATYAWSSGLAGNISTGSVSPVTNTTFTVTVTDVNTCSATGNIAVVVNSLPVPGASNTGPYCAGTTVQLNSSGGNAYSWSGPAGYLSAQQNPTLANSTVAMSGTYTVTVTNASTCTATASTNVVVNVLPVANAGTDKIITCAVPQPLLSAAPIGVGQTYLWSGPGIVSGGNTATPTVNAIGTYTLVLTDANNCTATDNAAVTSNIVPPNANAGPDAILTCTILSVTLTATSTTAGVNFAWSNGVNLANNLVSTANTYILTVTDPSNGCTATDQVVVNSNTTAPNANAGPDGVLTCVTLSVTLTATSTTAGATFAWSNGINIAGNAVNIANTYTVTVTDPINGCTASDNAIVSSNTVVPNANAGPDLTLTCINTTVTLTATSTTPGVNFVWSNGINTANNTVNTVNTYTVTVTDPINGCSALDNADVLSNTTIPNVNAGADQTLLCGVASLQLNGSSTTAGVIYTWSGTGIISGGNTASPMVNVTGTYTLLVTDPVNGCTASDATDILPDVNAPNANAGPDATLTCIITAVTLNASSTTAGVTFAWSNGINTTANLVSVAGTYTLTVTDPSNGCTSSDQATVLTDITPPNANAGPDAVLTCVVTSATLQASSTTPGAGFAWSTGDVIAATIVNAVNTYTVTVTNPLNGCTASDQAIVSLNNTPPDVNAGPDETISCLSSGITLTGSSATANALFVWSGAGIVSGANTAAPFVSLAGTYTLTVTDPLNGCTATDAANAVNPNPIVLSADTVNNPCIELALGLIDLHVNGGMVPFSYLWSNSALTEDIFNLHGGTYSVTVTDNNSCTATDLFTLTEGSFRVDAQQDATINMGESVQLTGVATGGSGQEVYVWTPDYNLSCLECTSPVAMPYTDVVYVLKATDTTGCTGYDTVTINVIPIRDIFIPNVFTPNGDGNNDYFEVFGSKQTWKQFEVQVFNRWGEKVFESYDMNFKWDGFYKSKSAPSSVYVYQVRVVYLDNYTDKLYKGSVTLVR